MLESTLMVDGITNDSEDIVNLFLDNFSTEHSKKTYVNALRRLFQMTGKEDFTELNYTDYCDAVQDNSGTNEKCLNSFFKFLYCQNFIKNENGFENCYWDKDKYKKYFDSLKKRRQNKQAISYSPALTIDKIEKLISFEEQVSEDDFDNLRLAFCFYMLYYENLNVNDLKNIDSINFKNGVIFISNTTYKIPEKYWKFLHFLSSRSNSKFSTANLYIDALGKKVGISNLVPKDITSSRDQNIFTCPQCGRKLLSFSEYWRSINGKLMCVDCAQAILNDNELKKNFIIGKILNNEIDILSNTDKNNIEHVASTFENLQAKLHFPTNFEELNEYLSKVGKLGEKYVYEQEKQRLKDQGSDFWELVDETPALNNANGFDILSYSPNGEKIYIEVKTTPGETSQPFFMSKNEIEKAHEIWETGGEYQIHRVSHVTDKILISRDIYKSLDKELFSFEEVVYKVTLKNKIHNI